MEGGKEDRPNFHNFQISTFYNNERKKFMLVTFIRAVVLYILVLIVMRFMGKREIRSTSAI